MMLAIRRRLAVESGFTLIELLVAIGLSAIVLTALINLLGATGHAGARIDDKSETVQRMRIGMDRITRVLRTQACASSSIPPIIDGQANTITFYSDSNTGTDFAPRKVVLTFANGTITQQTFVPTNTTSPWSYPAAPNQTAPLISGASLVAGTPLFAYYSWTDLTTPVAAPLDTSLSTLTPPANSITNVVRIDVTFKASATSGRTSTGGQTTATNAVYIRNADFSGVADSGRRWGPRCG